MPWYQAKNNLKIGSSNHFGAEGIRYFAIGSRKKNQLNKTKKRHISAKTTEKWRFWIIFLLAAMIIAGLQGAWRELSQFIP